LDAFFIKACSIRNPTDNQTGSSDTDARVGRSGRSFALGYKLHLSIDHKTMLPLSSVFASANQNVKKDALTILDKAKRMRAGLSLKYVNVYFWVGVSYF
jgi:hypothetical protein